MGYLFDKILKLLKCTINNIGAESIPATSFHIEEENDAEGDELTALLHLMIHILTHQHPMYIVIMKIYQIVSIESVIIIFILLRHDSLFQFYNQ